jgi:Na+-translocating ferredoxin:NAD+ oxidoreductase RnfG subunit
MPTQILFDRLAYIDRLTREGIAENQARAHAEAMDEALRESVATKVDVQEIRHEIQEVRHEIQVAVRDMTIRTGAMLIVLFGALSSIKFFG